MQLSQIIIKDLKFYGFHGVYPEEQVIGTAFRLDVILDIDSSMPGFNNDKISDTLNYESVVARILKIATKKKYKLLEHLAQVLCKEMLKFERVQSADITVYKLVNHLTPDPQWIGMRRVISKS